MRRALRRRLALVLAAALPMASLAALGEAGEAGDAPPEVVEAAEASAPDVSAEDVEASPEEAGEIDLLSPELYGEGDAPDWSGPTPTPELATPEPTPEPTPTPEPEIPFYTSVNYPEDKVNFEDEIWAILTRGWGLEDYQAAGFMSSLYAESSFCPYNAQFHDGIDDRGKYRFDSGDAVGFGLCQWTSAGRKANLYSFAVSRGGEDLAWDFDVQMAFMKGEVDLSALRATATLYEAAEWTVLTFERPSQSYRNSWPGTRYEFGKDIYRRHTGKRYPEPPLSFSIVLGEDAASTDYFRIDPAAGDVLGTLVVKSNYYWRLTMDRETEKGWLRVQSGQLNSPERLADCACGYVREGEKTLVLSVAKAPPPGETWSATLRFDIYRRNHVEKSVPVTLSCTGGGSLVAKVLCNEGLAGAALLGASLVAQVAGER